MRDNCIRERVKMEELQQSPRANCLYYTGLGA